MSIEIAAYKILNVIDELGIDADIALSPAQFAQELAETPNLKKELDLITSSFRADFERIATEARRRPRSPDGYSIEAKPK